MTATGARAAIDAYFSGEGGRFTGSQFEDLVDCDHPNEITVRDLVAVTMHSVQVPARPARWLLSHGGREAVHNLLREVPDDVDIWEPSSRSTSPAGRCPAAGSA